MYTVVALIGEAGTGKDTILRSMMYKYGYGLHEIISHTTRPPREGEKNGVNYYFISEEEFNDKILNDQLLEYAEFNNWYYGTALDALDENKINIGVFNPEGIKNLQRDDINLIVYRIVVPAKTRLLRQLNREENPDVDEIIRRFHTDNLDFCDLNFQYIEIENIDNEDIGLARYTIAADLGFEEL